MKLKLSDIIKKEKTEGLNNLTKPQLTQLKEFYTESLPYREGLDKLATKIVICKIEKLL